jgi:hypothetical protein
LSIFDANQPQFVYEFPTIRLVKIGPKPDPPKYGCTVQQHMWASRHLSATDRSPSPANAQGKSGPKDAETPRASRIVPALVFA